MVPWGLFNGPLGIPSAIFMACRDHLSLFNGLSRNATSIHQLPGARTLSFNNISWRSIDNQRFQLGHTSNHF
jgi:hypothetical protein